MMNEQIDPMNEQPNDQPDRQDIVSADSPHDATPGVKPAPQGTPPMNPPMNPPADTPGASVNQQSQEASPAQRAQQNAVDTAIPASGSRPTPDGASVEARDARPGPNAAPTRAAGQQGPGDAKPVPLLSADVAGAFLARWNTMQATFVDEPRRVVEQADSLVAEVMQRIAETMAQERKGLEGQWAAGDSVSTEDLRVALQHYRSFFQRLLSA